MNDLTTLGQEIDGDEECLILVTLFAVHGSTYRKPGARLLLTERSVHGLISGGCLEDEIFRRCEALIKGEQNTLSLEIDTRQYLGCDGRLSLWCERIEHSFLNRAKEISVNRLEQYCITYPGQSDLNSKFSSQPDPDAFSEKMSLPYRLLAFGSGPDVKPLIRLAKALDWQAEQILLSSDPSVKQSQLQEGTGIQVLGDASRVTSLKVDPNTACVVMNHHFGRDLELLRQLWNSSTPFLGLLGSRKRRDQILGELAFSGNEIDLESRELFAPVGLKLGAEGPKEIALEICAQILSVFSQRKPTFEARQAQ